MIIYGIFAPDYLTCGSHTFVIAAYSPAIVSPIKNIKTFFCMPEHHPLVDFSYLNELSGGDPGYIGAVLEIFLDTTPAGITQLEKLIKETDDWDAIYKQAHFLKSGVTIIKIKDLYEQFAEIEHLGRRRENRKRIEQLLAEIITTFSEVHPFLIEQRDKNKK